MPPRSAKMKRRIFGFQRRVWWPKWTPASSRSRMETAPVWAGSVETGPVETDMGKLLPHWFVVLSRRESRRTSRNERHARHGWAAGEWERDAGKVSWARSDPAGRFQSRGEVGRKR